MIISGTGHRPKSCPCKYDKNHPWLLKLKEKVKCNLQTLDTVADTGIMVKTGGAIGWDTWLAQVTLELELPLGLILPNKDQDKVWPQASRDEYRRILDLATTVEYVAEKFSYASLRKRNKKLVADADIIFALWNPKLKEGGTFSTVIEAQEKDKLLINFWDHE